MTRNAGRRAAALLASVVILFGSFRPVHAFAPVAVIGAPQIVSAGASYGVAALAGLIGLVGAYLEIKDAQDNAVRVPLGTDQASQPPSPSAPSTATQTIAFDFYNNNYDSACMSQLGGMFPRTTAASWEAACSAIGGSVSGSTCNKTVVEGTCGATYAWTASMNVGAVTGCPTGYTLTGGQCVLTNARQAVPDKRCDLLLSGGQYATADDVDCPATATGQTLTPLVRNGRVIAYGSNSSGQPLMFEVTPGATITTKIYEQTQAATQTQVVTTTIVTDAATGTVVSASTATAPGTVASPSASTLPTTTTSAGTTTDTPTVTQDQTKPIDIQTCGLPGRPACAVDDTGFGTYNPPAASSVDMAPGKSAIENLVHPDITRDGWFPSLLPGEYTACQPLTFRGYVQSGPAAGLDSSTTLDLCPYLAVARAFLGYLFGLGSVIYIWRRFTGANGGSAE